MRLRIGTIGVLAAAVLTFSVGAVAAFPTPSYAVMTNGLGGQGGQLNVLPSAVMSAAKKQAAGGASGTAFEIAQVYLYRAVKSPEFWQAMAEAKKAQDAAAAAGKPIPALPASVAAEAKTIYPIATKVAPFVKVVGGVGNAIQAYQLSSTATNGVLDMVGFDATGKVCTGTGRDLWGKVVQTAAGADCADYDFKMQPNYVPNTGTTGGYSMKAICSQYSTFCVNSYDGYVVQRPYNSSYACLSVGGKSGQGYTEFFLLLTQPDGKVRSNPISAYVPTDDSNQPLCKSSTGSADFARTYGLPDSQADALASGSRPFCIAPITADGAAPADCKGGAEVTRGSADPQRRLDCVVLGTDGKEYTTSSDPFYESSGVLPDPKCHPNLPDGVLPAKTTIKETGNDADTDSTVWQSESDPAVLDAMRNYGGCGTTTQCKLDLLRDGKTCFNEEQGGEGCPGWWKDFQEHPDRYRCEYGGKQVDVAAECGYYAPRWEPETKRSGNTLRDPETETPLKNPKPEKAPGSRAQVEQGPEDALGSYDCWPSGFGAFNPVNWVLQPIRCAFVPRNGYVEQQVGTIRAVEQKTYMGRFTTIVSGWDFESPGDGCSGIPIHIGGAIPDFTIMAACKGDMLQPMAGWGRIFLDLAVTVGGAFAISRYIASAVGFTSVGRKEESD